MLVFFLRLLIVLEEKTPECDYLLKVTNYIHRVLLTGLYLNG